MDPGPERFANRRRPVSFVKASSAASSSAATDKRAELSTFLQGDGSFVPFVPHSSSLDSMSEEDIDRVLEPVRQQCRRMVSTKSSVSQQKVTLSTKSKVSKTTRFQKGMQPADFIIYIGKYAWIFIRISVLEMLCLFKVYLLQFHDWVVCDCLWYCKTHCDPWKTSWNFSTSCGSGGLIECASWLQLKLKVQVKMWKQHSYSPFHHF